MKISAPIIDKFDFEMSDSRVLGEGSFGKVYLYAWKNLDVAVKQVRYFKDNKYIRREIEVLDKVKHPNVVQLLAISFSYTYIQIAMEYCKGNNLEKVIFEPGIKEAYNLVLLKNIKSTRK